MRPPLIQILLSTYNGEIYLRDFLGSLFKQTYENWHLIIRDDGSSDKTNHIINDYKKNFPKKITVVQNVEGNIGACQSFAALLNVSTAEYIMFSDQDDIWYNEKVETTYNKMLETETRFPYQPVLIHSDLEVVDDILQTIAPSMWKYHKINPDYGSGYRNLMVFNVITGCTMMINEYAKQCSIPIPTEAYMHDWWIAINTAKNGVIAYVDKPLVKYRIHGLNVSGVTSANFLYFLKKAININQTFEENSKVFKMAKMINCDISILELLLRKLRISLSRILP